MNMLADKDRREEAESPTFPWTHKNTGIPSNKRHPFRVGRQVPRNVYWGDEPMFMAATPELAAELVRLLNLGLDELK